MERLAETIDDGFGHIIQGLSDAAVLHLFTTLAINTEQRFAIRKTDLNYKLNDQSILPLLHLGVLLLVGLDIILQSLELLLQLGSHALLLDAHPAAHSAQQIGDRRFDVHVRRTVD